MILRAGRCCRAPCLPVGSKQSHHRSTRPRVEARSRVSVCPGSSGPGSRCRSRDFDRLDEDQRCIEDRHHSSDYRYNNEYLASVLKQYPGTFLGVCRVNPLDPAAPDHLSELTERGFRGVRLSPSGDASGDWIRGPLMSFNMRLW